MDEQGKEERTRQPTSLINICVALRNPPMRIKRKYIEESLNLYGKRDEGSHHT
jgi:hypothetical protein